MPFQSAPDCASCAIEATLGSQTIANVLNFHKAGGYNQVDINNLASVIDNEVGANYLGLMNGNVVYSGTHVRGLANLNDIEALDSTSAGPGTASNPPLPANVSYCVTLRTFLTGRSARGRFFAFPPGAGALQTSPNLVTTTYSGQVVAMIQGFITAAAAVGWNMIVLSRFTGGAPRTTATFFLVTSVVARNLIMDSQRGRLPKGH